jgi:hypothetical protein
MADRYDQALQALAEIPVPDQWEEITQRAARSGIVVPLDHRDGSRRQRRWRTLAAVAVLAALVAIGAVLLRRQTNDVVIDQPSTTEPESQQTAPSTTTAAPEPTDPIEAPSGGVPPPDISEAGNYPVSACSDIALTATDPPVGIEADMQRVSDDPRAPEGLGASLVGVFPTDSAQRAVLVATGWPPLADRGTFVDGPAPGTPSWIGAYDDGWVAHFTAPLVPDQPITPETSCPTTLIGVGIEEAQLRQFLAGLTVIE